MPAHLSERIAGFVFEELSESELAESRLHLAQCAECRGQVEQFQKTHAMLRTSVDVEPPRRIMFEFEKRPAYAWLWRWLAPMTASAAVALAVVTFAPRPPLQIVERVVQQPVTAAQPARVAAEPVDYQKIQEWLTKEMSKRDAAQAREMQAVRGQVVQLYKTQQVDYKDTAESIQYLVAKAETGLSR